MNRAGFRWAGVLVFAALLFVLSGATVFAADGETDANSGALIVAVIAGSPAADANLMRGDVILAMGDEVVAGNADLRALVQEASAGDLVPFTVRHGDDEYVVDVELGDMDGLPYLGVYLARDIELPIMEEEMTEDATVAEPADEAEADAATMEEDTAQAEAGEASVDEAPSDDANMAGEESAASESAADESEAAVVEEADEAEAMDAEAEAAAVEESEEEMAVEPDEAETTDDAGADDDMAWGMQPYTNTAAGAMIFAVVEDSPASDAGLNRGDVILGVDGERLQVVDDLATIVDAHDPGDEVTLEVLRRTGDLEDVAVTLGAHPEEDGKAFLGIGFLPTPRRMFLGHSRDGDLLVPPMPFWGPNADREGMEPWWQHGPHRNMLPEGHPSLDDDDANGDGDAGEMEKDTQPDAMGDDNA